MDNPSEGQQSSSDWQDAVAASVWTDDRTQTAKPDLRQDTVTDKQSGNTPTTDSLSIPSIETLFVASNLPGKDKDQGGEKQTHPVKPKNPPVDGKGALEIPENLDSFVRTAVDKGRARNYEDLRKLNDLLKDKSTGVQFVFDGKGSPTAFLSRTGPEGKFEVIDAIKVKRSDDFDAIVKFIKTGVSPSDERRINGESHEAYKRSIADMKLDKVDPTNLSVIAREFHKLATDLSDGLFNEIDTDKKGFITRKDLDAFCALARKEQQQSDLALGDALTRNLPDLSKAINGSGDKLSLADIRAFDQKLQSSASQAGDAHSWQTHLLGSRGPGRPTSSKVFSSILARAKELDPGRKDDYVTKDDLKNFLADGSNFDPPRLKQSDRKDVQELYDKFSDVGHRFQDPRWWLKDTVVTRDDIAAYSKKVGAQNVPDFQTALKVVQEFKLRAP